MNNKKILTISLLIFFSMIALLIFLICLPKAEEDKTIYYENKEMPIKVTVEKGENSFTVYKDSDKWIVSSLENIPINESFCYSLFSAAKSLFAEHIFEPKTSLDDYGLENPSIIVTNDFGDKQTTIKIGNTNVSNTAYYCLKEDSNQIGLISIPNVNPFLREISDYASLILIPYSMRTTDDDGNWISGGITSCTLKRQDLNEPIELIADENGDLNIVSPLGVTLSADAKNQLKNAPFSLAAESLYEVNPTDAAIDLCKLNSPKAEIKYVINGETYEFKIGDISSSKQYANNIYDDNSQGSTLNKSYYLMMKDIPAIYTAIQSDIPWLNMEFIND
ncbi:MAG: DUF4340 domain-containing protein [Oscillospiraceae bacterium]|nr:DUF4340 domain-containing protein [Oscillospiraceae bacterium]